MLLCASLRYRPLRYIEPNIRSFLHLNVTLGPHLARTTTSVPVDNMFGFFEGVTFDPSHDIPDLSGKVALITGGNTGLGKETVLELAKHNPSHLYLAARSPSKAEAAIQDIRTLVPTANITFLDLDLANLASVHAASTTVLTSSHRLDLLINNAGIMAQPAGLTADGYELQFGTNTIGHALLTTRLLPLLLKTAEEPDSDVRIVCLSSGSHSRAPPEGIIFPALTTDMAEYTTFQRYGQSKAANILFAAELARRYPGITSVSCHPGVIDTGLTDSYRSGNGFRGVAFGFVVGLMQKPLEEGVKNQLWCATGKGVVSGRFYFPVGVGHAGRGFPDDKALGKRLWEWTEGQLVKKGFA